MAKGPRFYQPARRGATPDTPFEVEAERQSHDGRGLCQHRGKTLFITGALPEERVRVRYRQRRGKYDEAQTLEVVRPSPQRVEPRCPHFGVCGGCQLQHQAPAAQLAAKQRQALDQLRRLGKVEPEALLPPLDGPHWHYRRRARLGIRCDRKGRPLLGFRQQGSNQLTAITQCPVLEPRGEKLLQALQAQVQQLQRPQALSHLEIALGDEDAALVVRHTAPLADPDRAALEALCQQQGAILCLQPGGPETLHCPNGAAPRLHYRLQEQTLAFHPGDFTQVNGGVNRAMVAQALALLDPQPGDRVLDLFCGLGNFTLPLARRAGEVVGVEGAEAMVCRGRENASALGLGNVHFYDADLTADLSRAPWFGAGFNKALLDPPRAGALEVIRQIGSLDIETLLYVSCDPATLARDAGELQARGYSLRKFGVMNMFPHTAHVESMALFTRR
ncbi:23S rRNA (uracil(1939)-C(5))-methyltransferase RlmD [Motiliproteus sp. SC1-56]|uniref:23S rRNA (uracil(1939)-C(5))-methyltransferase RlmD n=1 Tax=Motiliproteus sp. SC1-56 TaxID=2799565 RepID=UPI001A8FBF31